MLNFGSILLSSENPRKLVAFYRKIFRMLHNLATGNADDVDHSEGYLLAGWRNAHELALMAAAPGLTGHHLVAFGDHIVDRGFEVREGAAEHVGQLFDALTARRYSGREFFVINEAGSQQLVDQTHVSPIEDFLDEATQ